MAQLILNNVLNLSIPPEEIIKWLTADDIELLKWSDFNQRCTRGEFVMMFLNYLRIQFKSGLQNSNIVQSPVKHPQTIREVNESIKSCGSIKNKTSDIKSQLSSGKIISTPSKEVNRISDIFHTPNKANNSSVFQQDGDLVNLSGSFSPVPKLQSSTPEVKARSSPNHSGKKIRAELISYGRLTQNKGNNSLYNPDIENQNSYYDIRNSSTPQKQPPCINNEDSFPSLVKDRLNDTNSSVTSTIGSHKDYSDLFQSSTPQRSTDLYNSQYVKDCCQSPASPLYTNNASTVTPKNETKGKCRKNESSFGSNNSSKYSSKSRSTSRANFSLGDFITTSSRSSRKSSGKKNGTKTQLAKNDEDCNDTQSSMANSTSQSENLQRIRRRINPTRLNITNDKDCKDNSAFGVVTRSATVNPQFTEAPPTDKSTNTNSFEIERGLLRLERQKKPETTINGIVNDTSEHNNHLTVIPKTPRKIVPSKFIIPSLQLVTNIEVLDVLADLYCSILDHNLIINPMSELYFIIHLITVQYTCQSAQNVPKQPVQQSNAALKAVRAENSMMKKSLIFDASLGDIERMLNAQDKSICDQSYTYSTTSADASAAELGCSLIIDEAKDCLNEVNNQMENLSMKSCSEENSSVIDDDQVKSESECPVKDLGTPHNCAYFSTRVLNLQKDFIKSFDRATLKLLRGNIQIATFQPKLCEFLDKIYNIKFAESNKTKLPMVISTNETNVCFRVDTDNLKNFTSNKSFNIFRGQRDMFYEILRIWEQNHLNSSFNFKSALAEKIKSMLTVHEDISNYYHFARLFKSQMVISCLHSGQQVEDTMDDESLSFLKDLKHMNPEKLTYLRERLITPQSQNGPVPLPSFPGVQEFYKYFILYSSNSMFFTHLKDCLIHEILDLNDMHFIGNEIEDTETIVDECTKQKFRVCLSTLRLLAKFLGYLTSLPYQSASISTISELNETINYQVALRKRAMPELDLQTCLENAIHQGKLSLVLPWIVEFLATTDVVSLRLPYYTRLLEMLYCIYRVSDHFSITNSMEIISHQTAILIKLTLGWLFEQPHFPKDSYFEWQSRYKNTELKAICQVTTNNLKGCLTEVDATASVKHGLTLDRLDMIDERTLYACCPFLTELKILLISKNSNLGSSVTNRHITPVSSQLPRPMGSTNKKLLEFQLEEAFFNAQPVSTKKTVEFVSERIASSCVKHIFKTILPPARKKFLKQQAKLAENQNKDDLREIMNEEVMIIAKECTLECDEIIPKMCQNRASQSILALLAEDCLQMVKDNCIQIATRMAMERISQWIHSHILNGSIFLKDMKQTTTGSMSKANDLGTKDKTHSTDVLVLADITIDARDMMLDMLENCSPELLTIEKVSEFWDTLYVRLTEHHGPISATEKHIYGISVDLCIFLLAFRYDLFTTEIQNKAFKIWKMQFLKPSDQSKTPLSRILGPRNVSLFSEPDDKEVWIHCAKFITRLLDENFLTIDELSLQVVALFRLDWPTSVLKNLSQCLTVVLDNYKSSGEESEQIRYLLGWVADTCQNMDILDDDG